jgi:hypothetical protein
VADRTAILTGDLTAALADAGVAETLDGVTANMVTGPVELIAGEFERSLVERLRVHCLAAEVGEKVPGQIVTFRGKRWSVLTGDVVGVARVLVLERGVG